jgi:hypothetical protein
MEPSGGSASRPARFAAIYAKWGRLRADILGVFAMTKVAAWALLVALAALVGAACPSIAQPPNLEGSWSGGGVVSFASGARERARCRAHYSRRSSTTYALTATCATPSGRATQSASVRQVGGNSYQGSFYNSEYNVSGTIRVVVRGNSQSVQLTSESGSASLQLSR